MSHSLPALNASSITRRLHRAGLSYVHSHLHKPGVVRVWLIEEEADVPAAKRAARAALLQAGYDVADAYGYSNALLVTLPTDEPVPAEPVELPEVQPVPETGGEIRQTEHGARYYTAAELLTRRDEARQAAGLPPVRTETTMELSGQVQATLAAQR
jgi:hypothetical protein